MSDVNVVVVSGRLTRDVELRYTPNGNAVTDLGLASNQYSAGKESTLFTDVVVWGKQAESLAPYLNKGTFIVVKGRLQLDQWEKDGEKRSKLRVVADSITLGPRSNGGGEKVATGSEPVDYGTSVDDDESVPF